MATVLVASGLLGGCYTGIDTETDKLSVAFDLPDGWVFVDNQPGYVSAVTEAPPIVKIELVPNETFPGTEDDARTYAQGLMNFYVGSTPTSQRNDVFEETSLPGGQTIYTHVVPDYFEGGTEPAWSSRIVYYSDGHVVNLYLSDDASHYSEELNIITGSTKIYGGKQQ